MNTSHAAHVATGFPALISQAAARILASILRRSKVPAQSLALTTVLPKGETQWVDRPLGRVVVCEEGQLWLAFDNELQDIVLLAGQSHECATSARLSVHAMRSSKFRLQ
jgi:hypothetical protein